MRLITVVSLLLCQAAQAFLAPAPARFVARAATVVRSDKVSMSGFNEAVDTSKLRMGTCKWFDSTKGFGFITPEDGSPDVFVHQSEINAKGFRSLAEGEKVEYTLSVNEKTKKVGAKGVSGPNGAPVQGAPRQQANTFY